MPASPRETTLQARWAALREQFGALGVTAEAFRERVGQVVDERLAAGAPDLDAALERMCLDDLYLAMGCVAGHPRAMSRFWEEQAPALRRMTRRAAPGWAEEDGPQQLLASPFVRRSGDEASPGTLATYRGMGSLKGWLRVIARRQVLDILRAERRRTEVSHRAAEQAPPAESEPELAVLDAARRLRPVFAEALDALSPEQRKVLALRYRRGLVFREIGEALGTDLTSAYRAVSRAQKALLRSFQERAGEQLGLSDADLRSVLTPLSDALSLDELFSAVALLLLATVPLQWLGGAL
jgi:RNA polymerase sigma-70 factor